MEDKLIELESKFSFQEDILLELNQVVIRQQKQIDELVREMSMLKQQIEEVSVRGLSAEESTQQNEQPPHY